MHVSEYPSTFLLICLSKSGSQVSECKFVQTFTNIYHCTLGFECELPIWAGSSMHICILKVKAALHDPVTGCCRVWSRQHISMPMIHAGLTPVLRHNTDWCTQCTCAHTHISHYSGHWPYMPPVSRAPCGSTLQCSLSAPVWSHSTAYITCTLCYKGKASHFLCEEPFTSGWLLRGAPLLPTVIYLMHPAVILF